MEDPWAKHNIPSTCPAERVIRHIYDHKTNQWSSDETIVKIQKEPFTNGAMRHCYRMKKIATPPKHSSNHRFHSYGWSHAFNYVAKAYLVDDGTNSVDTSQEAKNAVFNDVVLQYEAAHWAEKFNDADPPRKIDFIRAYAMEFPDRPNSPVFAVERFIAGKGSYGAGFTKHNTNSGFVDLDLHRITPQVFSAYSFYASQGTRLVADIQGIGDLYTDPQILSDDYRFGDGDLGPRGMALFFKTFRHCSFSDSMGIPIFKLSRNELKHQAKYEDEDDSVSDESSLKSDKIDSALCNFAKLDINRQARRQSLITPRDLNKTRDDDTERRTNLSKIQKDVSKAIRSSLMLCKSKPSLNRTKSDVDEVKKCLEIALNDPIYDHRAFNRLESGELRKRGSHNDSNTSGSEPIATRHTLRKTMMKKVLNPMMPTDETRANLGKVHYHLACLHGVGRFPEIVQITVLAGTTNQTMTYSLYFSIFATLRHFTIHPPV
uniref:Alpha-type protein kinase domain-containing protein n=2 Tax=Ditylum brightwellii TaxID=49249 RepID=A0A7S4QDH5_9STRA